MGYIDDKPIPHFRGRFNRDEYQSDEEEFIKAMDCYIRENRRKFPAFSEVLAVLKHLGYKKTGKNTFAKFLEKCKKQTDSGEQGKKNLRGDK